MLQVIYKGSKVNIHFGKIQDVTSESNQSVVVLPANEYFDDECIQDTKSSLGSYINNRFQNLTSNIQDLIRAELDELNSEEVEKEPGVIRNSFGIGSSIYLKKPLGSDQSILLLSVTTKRSGEGLKAEASNIFLAIKKMQKVAADERISSVCVPILGTGHGGLTNDYGLLTILLAIFEGITISSSHHIKEYNIVVFRGSKNDKPAISIRKSKQILQTAVGFISK